MCSILSCLETLLSWISPRLLIAGFHHPRLWCLSEIPFFLHRQAAPRLGAYMPTYASHVSPAWGGGRTRYRHAGMVRETRNRSRELSYSSVEEQMLVLTFCNGARIRGSEEDLGDCIQDEQEKGSRVVRA